MQDDAEGDMTSDAQTKSKNDPLAHHVNLSMRPDRKRGTLRRMARLGSGGFGRFNLGRGNETGQVIRHEVQRFFTTVGPAAFFPPLHR